MTAPRLMLERPCGMWKLVCVQRCKARFRFSSLAGYTGGYSA